VCKTPEAFPHIDLILIDEAHLVPPKLTSSYGKFLNMMTKWNPACKVIGFTATPYRLGQGMLTDPGGIFTDMNFNITDKDSFNRLIDEGYLCNLVVKKTEKELDVSNVKIQGGDFVLSHLQDAVDQTSITKQAIKELLSQGEHRNHWLIFGTGIKHCCNICDELQLRGVKAAVVHSKMSDTQRDTIIADFKKGIYRALVNNNILTTGFDMPGIDLIGCLRPTMSPNLWVQLLGRGTRPVYALGYDLETIHGRLAAIAAGSKKECLVLDFAGNTRRIGPVNDPMVPKAKGKQKRKGDAPVKVCEVCNTYNHASVTHCTQCGEEFPKHTKLEQHASSNEVISREKKEKVIAPPEIFKIDLVTYEKHSKAGSPDSVKVNYRCGLRSFSEWVCFEHTGFAYHNAKIWWTKRSVEQIPETTNNALNCIENLDCPTHIKISFAKRWPEIVGIDFSNTAFKTKEPENIPGQILT